MAELDSSSASLDHVHKTKSLICALNLLSRNLPLPPDLFDVVSSIYECAPDALLDGDEGLDGPHSSALEEDLLADLGDALLEQRQNFISGASLIESKQKRYESHIQHRLTELEELPSSRGEDLQTKCLLELYGLKLAELQKKVRSEVSSEYSLRMHCEHPDKTLFDWGMMRLRRPLYGVGDAFAMEADDQFRKKRDAEVLS